MESAAEILREYGPFPDAEKVHGVTFDGRHVWFASGDRLNAFDPASGKLVRTIAVPAHAGTAFDGRHLFQIAEDRIQKIDPQTGRVVATIPAPGGSDWGSRGPKGRFGWDKAGAARSIKSIRKRGRSFAPSSATASSPVSPGSTASSGTAPGRVMKAICGASIREPARYWIGSKCRPGWACRELESDGGERFFCGGGSSGKVRAIRRPRRGTPAGSGAKTAVPLPDPSSA